MKNALTRKVLISSASTTATTSRTGSSRRKEPFFGSFRGWSGSGCASVPTGVSSDTRQTLRCRPVRPASAGDRVPLLLDLGGLAAQLAQVVELGAADVAAGGDLDLLDDRGVHREGALDADTEADLADGEGLPDAAALAADDHALEELDPLAGTLDYAHVHLQRVAGAEVRDVGTQRLGVQGVQRVHLGVFLRVRQARGQARRGSSVRESGPEPARDNPSRVPHRGGHCETRGRTGRRRPRAGRPGSRLSRGRRGPGRTAPPPPAGPACGPRSGAATRPASTWPPRRGLRTAARPARRARARPAAG